MKTLAYRFTALLFAALLAASLMAQTPVRVVAPSALPTGASTLAEQQAQTTALQLLDNAVSGAGFNITQQGGVAISLNTGVRDSGTQRVTIATNDLVPVTVSTFPDNEPINLAQVGGTAVVLNPCAREAPLYVVIDQTSGEQLVTGTASERIYICSVQLVTATAQNVALVSGTGTVCATSTGPLMGGTTAATGWNLAANGGLTMGNGIGSLAQTDTNADNVCVLQSGAGQVSGSISYVSL